MKYIDLHSHTCYSDGTSTVENSLKTAESLSLEIFSVSDHNSVGAYGEIKEKRSLFSGSILPAVELSTTYDGESIEILGYGVDVEKMNRLLGETYYSFREKQIIEAALDVRAVREYGAVLDPDFVCTMINHPERMFDPSRESNRPYLLCELQRHPENVRFFKSKEEFEAIDCHRFTRDYLFNSKSTLYSDQSSLFPTLSRVIDMIHSCGGLAFLAHPLVYSKDFSERLDEVAGCGIDGMECSYGIFTRKQRELVSSVCERHCLYRSGGSDFHGLDMRPMNLMGLSSGDRIPLSLIEDWLPMVKDSLM